MSERLVRADDFEIDNGDGTIAILPGNPRYCPVEHVHDPHNFAYAYLSRDGHKVTGSYECFGEPAPWAAHEQAGCLPDDVYLGYTIQDDGVHLFCHRCLWDDNLGFNATVADATAAVTQHCWGVATTT